MIHETSMRSYYSYTVQEDTHITQLRAVLPQYMIYNQHLAFYKSDAPIFIPYQGICTIPVQEGI